MKCKEKQQQAAIDPTCHIIPSPLDGTPFSMAVTASWQVLQLDLPLQTSHPRVGCPGCVCFLFWRKQTGVDSEGHSLLTRHSPSHSQCACVCWLTCTHTHTLPPVDANYAHPSKPPEIPPPVVSLPRAPKLEPPLVSELQEPDSLGGNQVQRDLMAQKCRKPQPDSQVPHASPQTGSLPRDPEL